VLFDVAVKGKMRHAISAPGKTGWLYILDRNSGHPLLGILEKKVPQEKTQFTSPTQPHPVGDAFADQCAHKEDYTNAKTGKILKAPDGNPYKVGCIFTPYNTKQFVAYAPGTEGGLDWQPSSYNTRHALPVRLWLQRQHRTRGVSAGAAAEMGRGPVVLRLEVRLRRGLRVRRPAHSRPGWGTAAAT